MASKRMVSVLILLTDLPDCNGAIFRLTQNDQIQFDAKLPCFLPKEKFCPFNSQNTFFHSIAFFTLYIPSCTSMRVSDIWRGYISQRLLWECDARLVFSGPNAIQNRNTHSLLHDFSQEQSLYLQASAFVDFLKQWKGRSTDPLELIEMLFSDLVHNAFFDPNELTLLRAWLKDLQHVSYIPRLKLPSNSLLIERHEKVRAETSLYDDETGI